MVKVKICANRNIEDAKMSLDAKTDVIGILVRLIHISQNGDIVTDYKKMKKA